MGALRERPVKCSPPQWSLEETVVWYLQLRRMITVYEDNPESSEKGKSCSIYPVYQIKKCAVHFTPFSTQNNELKC